MDIFVYGTLRDDQLIRAVTGTSFRKLNATLAGFRRVELPNRYPWVEPAAGCVVEGQLLCNVDELSLQRLDEYEAEGALYRRERVTVVAAGEKRACSTYVGIAERVRQIARS